MSNKVLCLSIAVAVTGIVVVFTEKQAPRNDGFGTTASATIQPFIQDCREDKAAEQMVELPGATGHAQAFGGSGAGCLEIGQSIPSGGLRLEARRFVAPSKPVVVVHGKRYLLAHHPSNRSFNRLSSRSGQFSRSEHELLN